jgi:TetR/AcrR family transcriptional regulator, cholesterol catabolism regulator
MSAFLRHGFKSVTVDDIAKDAGISKKTLYEQFGDKDALIKACLFCHEQEMERRELELFSKAENAIHEIIMVMGMLEEMLKSMNVNCIPDLQKYYPSAFVDFRKHMDGHRVVMLGNIKRGVKEGLYRKDFDADFAVWMRLEHTMILMQNPAIGRDFNFVDAQLDSLKFFLYGISTIEGHQLIEKYISQLKKKK